MSLQRSSNPAPTADRRPNRRTGFDSIRFYRNVAFELAAMGF